MMEESYGDAWGDKTVIVGDDEIELPSLPKSYEWLISREMNGEYPYYLVRLVYSEGSDFKVLEHGRIDKALYGEKGVKELAAKFADKWKKRVGEVHEALKSLSAKGFMVDNGDGTFTPTPLGHLVSKAMPEGRQN